MPLQLDRTTDSDDFFAETRMSIGDHIEMSGGFSSVRAEDLVEPIPERCAGQTWIAGFMVNAGGGDDTASLARGIAVPVTLRGGPGNDRLVSGAGDDRLQGGIGDDTLVGRAGNDSLLGGPGNDRLIGCSGNDLLRGEAGEDFLAGGSGSNDIAQ